MTTGVTVRTFRDAQPGDGVWLHDRNARSDRWSIRVVESLTRQSIILRPRFVNHPAEKFAIESGVERPVRGYSTGRQIMGNDERAALLWKSPAMISKLGAHYRDADLATIREVCRLLGIPAPTAETVSPEEVGWTRRPEREKPGGGQVFESPAGTIREFPPGQAPRLALYPGAFDRVDERGER